jgi:hypothetical protein
VQVKQRKKVYIVGNKLCHDEKRTTQGKFLCTGIYIFMYKVRGSFFLVGTAYCEKHLREKNTGIKFRILF